MRLSKGRHVQAHVQMKRVQLYDPRSAEKKHVRLMSNTEWLDVKPFLGGTGLDIDRALMDIAVFGGMVNSLPCGPGSLILDLGAGPCWVSDWLQKLRFRTCSIDLSAEMLEIGRKRLAAGSLLCAGDRSAIPLRDQTVDAALCYSALHHVPDWRGALKEIHRVLRRGGVAVLQEPGRGHASQMESIVQVQQFGVLEQELPAGTLARACRQAGFTRVVVRPVAELALGRSRILPFYPFWKAAPKLFLRKALSRLRAAVIEKCLNLVSPLRLVVAVKDQAWPDSRRPDTMVAKFRCIDCPEKVQTGQVFPVSARILNTGLTRWLAETGSSPLGRVRLGISVLDADGRFASLDFARLDLPRDVDPGSEVEIRGQSPALKSPGVVKLRFDLVAEGVCWFSARGSKPDIRRVEVVS